MPSSNRRFGCTIPQASEALSTILIARFWQAQLKALISEKKWETQVCLLGGNGNGCLPFFPEERVSERKMLPPPLKTCAVSHVWYIFMGKRVRQKWPFRRVEERTYFELSARGLGGVKYFKHGTARPRILFVAKRFLFGVVNILTYIWIFAVACVFCLQVEKDSNISPSHSQRNALQPPLPPPSPTHPHTPSNLKTAF